MKFLVIVCKFPLQFFLSLNLSLRFSSILFQSLETLLQSPPNIPFCFIFSIFLYLFFISLSLSVASYTRISQFCDYLHVLCVNLIIQIFMNKFGITTYIVIKSSFSLGSSSNYFQKPSLSFFFIMWNKNWSSKGSGSLVSCLY